MEAPDLTTVIVVSALVGLFSVALGYAQMVWLARQKEARAGSPTQQSSPLLKLLMWTCAVLATVCFLRAVTTRTLPGRQGFLVGEDLFSVRPRPGLVAKYETTSADVHRDEALIRFTGSDGEEATRSVKNRRGLLEDELEIERARPLEFDPEIVRRAEGARAALREREQRLKQLVSERDSITREATHQRLAIGNRWYRLEQDDQAAARELTPLRARLKTERGALKSQEELLKQGLVSRMEAARERDALTELEGRLGQLEDQRAIFAREQREIANLRALSEKTLAQQLGERTAELATVTTEIEAARKGIELATRALDQDRPRAVAQREKRLREIEIQIQDLDSLLNGSGRHLVVEAPWDGRIGFREPSPSSAPADNGPLLVMYRPGKIGATVRLEPDETEATDSGLRAEIQVVSSSPNHEELGRTEALLPGAIVQRTLLPGGAGEIQIACDPPERVVRQLAMGGTVPVLAHLRRGVTHATSFRVGLGFGGLAIVLAVFNLLRRHIPRGQAAEPPGFDPRARGRNGIAPTAPGSPGAAQPFHAFPWQPAQAALPAAAAFEDAALEDTLGLDDPANLFEVGAKLRMQVEGGVLAPELVRLVREVLMSRGYRAAALVGAGFGVVIDKQSIERAAFGLLAAAPAADLGDATRDCAEFLRIMRAIGSERMNGTLDRLRLELIVAALDAAERGGSSSETAANVVKPLVEA